MLHDVGTLTSASGRRLNDTLLGLDTPTLRDVWRTAPYLHDGSATTLYDVLTSQNNNDAHGVTSSLSSQQVDQLVAYLQQIDGSEPAINESVTLALTSPTDGTLFERAEPINFSVNTNVPDVSKVVYYVDGEPVVEATTAPFTAQWTPIKWGSRHVQAKLYYNNGRTATVSPEVNFIYKRQLKAILVVGDPANLHDGDVAIINRLESQGYIVSLLDDDDATSNITSGQDIMLISSTVIPSSIGEDLTREPVPTIIWGPFDYSFMKLTGGVYNTDFGFTDSGVTTVNLPNSAHPMSGGLSGEVALYYVDLGMPFGIPGANADVIAEAVIGANSFPVIFGYEKGTTMASGMNAPHRRVAFPLRHDFYHLLSPDGWQMFDATLQWAMYGGDETTPIQPLPDILITGPGEGQIVDNDVVLSIELEGWNAQPGGTYWRYWLDGSQEVSIYNNGPVTLNNVPDGNHEIRVQLVTQDHKLINAYDTVNFIVSSGAPTVTPTPAVSPTPTNTPCASCPTATPTNTPVPTNTPDPNAVNVKVQYMAADTQANNNAVKPHMQLVNNSVFEVALTDLTIRYWFTKEGGETLQYHCDYAVINCSQVSGVFVPLATAVTGADHYLEISFSGGTLAPGANTGQIQNRFNRSNWGNLDESNDYSFDGSKTAFADWDQITLYHNGTLIWGTEPGSGGPPTNTPPAPTATNTPPPPTATNTPPAPTATNTPPAPPTATNTPPAPPTATNTPLPTATNTPPAPPTATNTPPAPPTATNTPPAPPTATNTPVPTATNTPFPTATHTPVPTATPATGGSCSINYNIANDWGSGATVQVTITNSGSTAINGWTLAWTFSGNQSVTNAWNGNLTQTGTAVTVTDVGWNGTLSPNGGSASFGFNLNYSGSNTVPTPFTLNGSVCN